MDSNNTAVKIVDGAHAPASFTAPILLPLFESGSIKPYPGAADYCVCYGELCAYDSNGKLLATWNGCEFPGCIEDAPNGFDFASRSYSSGWTI